MPSGPARSFRLIEWKSAARGGAGRAREFAWGDEFTPGGRHFAPNHPTPGRATSRTDLARADVLGSHLAGARLSADSYGVTT